VSRCDQQPPQAIPRHPRPQQCQVDQHYAIRSSCGSRQRDLLTMPRARAGRGAATEQRRLPVATVTDRRATTKMVAPVCSTRDGRCHDVRTPSLSSTGPKGPTREGEGWCSPRAPFLLVFLFPLFLYSLSLMYPKSFPWPIKGKVGRPIWESSEALQLHFTFTRDLGLLSSLARL
jgi:hypothetical protein